LGRHVLCFLISFLERAAEINPLDKYLSSLTSSGISSESAERLSTFSFANISKLRYPRLCEKDAKDPTLRDRARTAASKGGHMTIPFEKLKARLLANPKVKAEYDALAPEFEIAAELLRARLRAGLSQAELAARMGTSQSTIARLESGQTLPSTKTLLRYAEATGSKFHVRLSAA
jgi:ribosome-binding protein aMBF1 (putative translation factor)